MAFIFAARVVSLRDMGGCPNPFGSFQLLMGLETLSLRGARHSENANKLAAWLEQDPRVAWVSHLSLPAHNSHEKAKKYFRTGTFGAVLSFGVKGGAKAAALVIDSVKLATHLANVGDAKTLVIQPAATTHQQLTEQEQIDCGVKPDMIRVSVGIETIADIIADFDQALSAKPAAAAAAAVEDAEVKGLDTEVKPDESCCSIV
jgi:O-acetylhomoserine/O-acetylserine sulfhydrylase-like pyridoxal-dependent enzyme